MSSFAGEPVTTSVDRRVLVDVCVAASVNAGASVRVADLLTHAALFAEDRGFSGVGVSHLLDYLTAMEEGRLDGEAVPEVRHPIGAMFTSDARTGILHTGFDEVFTDLVITAHTLGVAVFTQHNAYSGGQLGWFTERLAEAGLISLATVTSPALLAAGPGTGRVFGTNPMAYSVPRSDEQPITVDQSSSVAAFVSVRAAAARGETIPAGWAVDARGQPTTDATAALAGAMLPFGGYKGTNIAWLVEFLSSMAGGHWSVDAPPFDSGSACPSIGMFVLALDAEAVGSDFPARVQAHVDRLAARGVRRPGVDMSRVPQTGHLAVSNEVLASLRHRAGSPA